MDRQVTSNPHIEMQREADLTNRIVQRTSYDGQPIGKGTTTLDMLQAQHPWLKAHIENLERQIILGFYEAGEPQYRQNLSAPNGGQHELEEVVTAEECNNLVSTIVSMGEERTELRDLTNDQRVTIANLREENRRLRQKNHSQRLELRRLNAAHLAKNARIVNLEHSDAVATDLVRQLTGALDQINDAYLSGNLIVR
jgi:hypothetical protein